MWCEAAGSVITNTFQEQCTERGNLSRLQRDAPVIALECFQVPKSGRNAAIEVVPRKRFRPLYFYAGDFFVSTVKLRSERYAYYRHTKEKCRFLS